MDEGTAADFVRLLASLHALDWDAAERSSALVPPAPSDATRVQIERWAAIDRGAAAAPVPLLDEAEAWLHRHAPPLDRVAVVHGDAGPGNVVQAAAAVLP
jgi:aminoglycoside phosphotransferase (APT) family kinase protein